MGDLNSRGKIPQDFQSCAIPGYAISAVIPASRTSHLSLLQYSLHAADSVVVKSRLAMAGTLPLWLRGIASHW